MRSLLVPAALSVLLAVPAFAQAPTFITVDIVNKSHGHHARHGDDPTEVHIRMPISLAKGVLDLAGETDIKIDGRTPKQLKLDQFTKLLEAARPGDLLLELTTDRGDLVKITVQ